MGDYPVRSIAIVAAIDITLGVAVTRLFGQETRPDLPIQYAANLYQAAAGAITVRSPSASDFPVPPYPPDSADWRSLAMETWDVSASVRRLARKARPFNDTEWPEDTSYLIPCRELAHNLGDAALYLDFQGRHAEAVEEVRDVFHLADLLEEKRPSNKFLVRVLTGAGIRAIAANRLEEIASAAPLTNDSRNEHDVQISTAHELITQLLATRKAIDLLTDTLGGPPGSAAWMVQGKELNERIIETFGRIKAECTFAAISLACHLFRSDRGRWPNDLSELVPKYLPTVPIDPWSNGKVAFAYVVIKDGLPDGSDRPLIYCRCNSPDGLFFRIDQPEYSYYNEDGSDDKHGGQFRDIVRWRPQTNFAGPTTQPLP